MIGRGFPCSRVLKLRFLRPKLLAAMFCLDFHDPTRERGTRDGRCRERHNFFTCLHFGLILNPIAQLQNSRVGLVFACQVLEFVLDAISSSTRDSAQGR
jgi:hypothetical protein